MKIQALIVDDEPQSIEVLREKINWNRVGVEQVFGAYSAAQARTILDQEQIPLILCDIEMPGENGLEFIQWLREESNLNGKLIECIILTCFPDYAYMRKAMQIGCSDYLIKPVNPSEVETVIRKAVQKIHDQEVQFVRDSEEIQMSMHLNNSAEVQSGEHTTNGTEMFYGDEGSSAGATIIEQTVIPYIREHYTEMLTVTEIASYAALNPQYMMRLFKKRTGASVLEYVTDLRLEKAKELLKKTDWTNEFISDRIGYASSNYFIKLFKTQYGMTPREFRKSNH